MGDRSELTHNAADVQRRSADTLHVSSHGQLTVEVNSKEADVGLKGNVIITELNIRHVDFQELLSTAQPNELSSVRVQFKAVS